MHWHIPHIAYVTNAEDYFLFSLLVHKCGLPGSIFPSNVCFIYPTECNYRNGKWVSDNRRPLYSGFGCKQWLSESWSCRLTQRTDFAYEKFRWQPEACEMPEFEASRFLRRYMTIASPR
jgi:hypothetical protein